MPQPPSPNAPTRTLAAGEQVWGPASAFSHLLLQQKSPLIFAPSHCALQESKFGDLPYFLGLASMTIYIGAHRGLNNRQRQQISLKEGALAPLAASGGWAAGWVGGRVGGCAGGWAAA